MWLKENNPAYSNIIISQDRLDALPLDEEINVISIHYNDNTKHTNDKGPASDQNAPFEQDIDGESASSVLLTDPVVTIPDKIETILQDLTNEKSTDKKKDTNTPLAIKRGNSNI